MVKVTPLLATPLTITTKFPVVAPAGTGATMLVGLQLVGVMVVPLYVTALVPCEAPKFAPEIMTEVPTGPLAGLKLVIVGGKVTVNSTPLLATALTVTTTFPVVAPLGTDTEILVSVHPASVTAVPLNVTVLVPCDAPKFVPLIVTEIPTGPKLGLKAVMLGGGGVTIKLMPLLATPLTVTTTFPLVAPAGTGTEMLVVLQLV